MNKRFLLICMLICGSWFAKNSGYGLPILGLGSSSFLDGGPLRQIPGWYAQAFNQFYTTHRFLDDEGKLLGGIPSPRLNNWNTALQFIYLSQKDFLGLGNIGFDITLPITFYSRIQKNLLGITDSGSGFGDLIFGVFAQADAIFKNGEPFYVHRLEFAFQVPSGKNELPLKTINPGNRVVLIDPYWSATLYFTPKFSASWRLHYLWVSANHIIHFKAGDTIHGNYALEYAITPRFYVGLNGYFLQQIKNNTLNDVEIPNSRERVVGIGFGGLYSFARRFANVFIVNFFWETAVRNRPQGFKFLVRYLRHF